MRHRMCGPLVIIGIVAIGMAIRQKAEGCQEKEEMTQVVSRIRFLRNVMLHVYQCQRNPMLVLSRYVGERIYIGDHVTVTVVRIGPSTVRLGIEAPKGLDIVREELEWQERKAARLKARELAND